MKVTRWRYTSNGYCKCAYDINDPPTMPDRLDWRFKEPKPYVTPPKSKQPIQLEIQFEW